MTEITDRRAHWENVYTERAEDEVSWFQETPAVSLQLIRAAGVANDAAIIDVGGGASRLVDSLLDEGCRALTVLDVSEQALDKARARLGERAGMVEWVAADVTIWEPTATYDLWHDRAAFHFLTNADNRGAYIDRLLKALRAGGHLIVATFAPDGPERCSGLPIVRYDAASLGKTLGPDFTLVETCAHDHLTPAGRSQRFQFSRFTRNSSL